MVVLFQYFPYTFQIILLKNHELIKRLHKRYREEGIDISYPVRMVYIKDKAKQYTHIEYSILHIFSAIVTEKM